VNRLLVAVVSQSANQAINSVHQLIDLGKLIVISEYL